MNKLDITIKNNDEVKEYFDIPYELKLNVYHFNIDNNKYYFYPIKRVFKYKNKETEVSFDFTNDKARIELFEHHYHLNLIILKSKYTQEENIYKIEYVLESEPEIKKTIIITFR